jgi:hypothetical protein
LSFHSPSENSRHRTAAGRDTRSEDRAPRRRHLPWVFVPYSVSLRRAAAHEWNGALPAPNRLHLRVFSTPWCFGPPVRLPALFRAGSAHGVSPFRALLPRMQPSTVSGERCPLVVRCAPRGHPKTAHPPQRRSTTTRHPASIWKPHRHAPRPQGFAPHRDPPHRVRCLGAARARSSPGILSLQGLSTARKWKRPSPLPPLMGLRSRPPHRQAGRDSTPPFRVLLPAWLGPSPKRRAIPSWDFSPRGLPHSFGSAVCSGITSSGFEVRHRPLPNPL